MQPPTPAPPSDSAESRNLATRHAEPARARTRRLRELHRSFARELRRRTGVRAGGGIAVAIAAGFGLAIVVQPGDGESARPLIASSLWGISIFGVGPAAVSLAGHSREPCRDTRQLAALRGIDWTTVETARYGAGLSTLFGVALWPSVALCALAGFSSVDVALALSELALVVPVALYAAALAIALGTLAHVSVRLVPHHARFTVIALLLIPQLLRAIWPNTPSVPAAFDWLLGMTFRSTAP
ncbi:MAG TPA: hypothetical protein VF989_08590 [Polyangiaceae bacterium]